MTIHHVNLVNRIKEEEKSIKNIIIVYHFCEFEEQEKIRILCLST